MEKSSTRARLEISSKKLKNNLKNLRSLVADNTIFMCVLKANAYGHGMVEVAEVLKYENVDYYGVATFEEGLKLRQLGIKTPVAVFTSITNTDQVDFALRHDLEFTVSSYQMLEYVKKGAKVHIKFDTGMCRQGILSEDLDTKKIGELQKNNNFHLKGICSHFAASEEQGSEITDMQLERFNCIRQAILEDLDIKPPIFHIANSAGVLFRPNSHFDLVRVGLSLYGMNPSTERALPVDLKYIGKLEAKIVSIKTMQHGGGVSYGHSWSSKSQFRAACISIGYGDGYMRAYSNKARVFIEGVGYRQIIGVVCMDLAIIKLEPEDKVSLGQSVILLDDEHIPPSELAEHANTINYEVTTSLSRRIKRYIR